MHCKHDKTNQVTCGNCHNQWCDKCDPAPAALCHWCHGRGYALPVPNVRFNWNNTTITMRPGQRLNHYQSGPTDEGYSYSAVTFEYMRDGSAVIAEASNGGRDCDGTHENYADLILDLTSYQSRRAGFQLEGQHQRDQYAELSNY